MNRRTWKPLVAAALLVSPYLAGCNRQQEAPSPPVPEVAVVTVQPGPVVLTSELRGRTCGYLVAEIRPQVNGLIKERRFAEGSDVKAEEVLFKIDPAPYQAALDSADANRVSMEQAAERARAVLATTIAGLKRHQAILRLAVTNRDRNEKLLKSNAVSTMEYDQSVADVDVADAGLRVAEAQVESDRQAVEVAAAAVKQAEAAMETARINLDYTDITAPISGRIGRSIVTEGAIVTAYQPAALATIQQFDPIYVDVTQSTKALNRLKRSLANGRLKDNGTDGVKIILEDGTEYPEPGSLKFRDVTVDSTTGSVILRIVVPNPKGILLPGMFVGAIVDEGVDEQAILIPQQAVLRDPKGNPDVLIVDKEGRVQKRRIATDRAMGTTWLVSSGLARGDRVIVEGMQRAKPGKPVTAVPFVDGRTNAEKPAIAVKTATH